MLAFAVLNCLEGELDRIKEFFELADTIAKSSAVYCRDCVSAHTNFMCSGSGQSPECCAFP